MMKKYGRLLILLGVLAAVIAAIFAVKGIKVKKEIIRETDEVVLEIPRDTVTALSWKNENGSFSFHREGDGWGYDDDPAFPADPKKIEKMLSIFEKFGAAFVIDSVEDPSQYGLNVPEGTVNLTAADGVHQILMGAFSPMDQQRYVSIGDGKAYLVREDPMELFSADLSDVAKNDENLSCSIVSAIRVSGTEDLDIFEQDYTEDSRDTYCKDDIYFLKSEEGNLPLDTKLVNEYLSAVSTLDLTDYVTYKASPEELQSFGLDHPELRVEIQVPAETDAAGQVVKAAQDYVLSLSRPEETMKLLAEEEKAAEAGEAKETEAAEPETDPETGEVIVPDDGYRAYVRIGESPFVYPVSRERFDQLAAVSYDTLRAKKLFRGSLEGISGFDIDLDGESYTFRSTVSGKGIRKFTFNGQEVDLNRMETAMADLAAEEFTEEEPDGKMEVGATLYLDNGNFPTIRFELYRYDGTRVLAKLNGKPFGLVNRNKAVVFMERIYEIVLGKKE